MKTETKIRTVQSKHNEVRFTATSPEEMFGHYAAEDINQVWEETFIDEESGQTVPVKRHQLLFEKGTFFDNRNIDSVRFHYEAGAFKEAIMSNQCRLGKEIEHYGLQAYKVKVSVSGKNRIIVCQARSLTMAHEIVQDWCELHMGVALFLIVSISELSTGIILNAVLKKREDAKSEEEAAAAEATEEAPAEEPLPALEEEAAPDPEDEAEEDDVDLGGDDKKKDKSQTYYEVQLEVHYKTKSGTDYNDIKSFLVQAKDADAAREACFGYIDLNRHDEDTVEEIRIVSASPFNCYKVIEREFTATYIDAEAQKSNE